MREITDELKEEILKKVLKRDKNATWKRRGELLYPPDKVYFFSIVDDKIMQWEESVIYESYEYGRLYYEATEVVNIDEGKREQVLIINVRTHSGPVIMYLYFQS